MGSAVDRAGLGHRESTVRSLLPIRLEFFARRARSRDRLLVVELTSGRPGTDRRGAPEPSGVRGQSKESRGWLENDITRSTPQRIRAQAD